MPESPWRGRHGTRRAASRGRVLPLVDVRTTRERSLPTPCRRGGCLHVSQRRLDRAAWRSRQREVKQAAVVPDANDRPPCPFGDMPSVDGPGSSPGRVVSGGDIAEKITDGRARRGPNIGATTLDIPQFLHGFLGRPAPAFRQREQALRRLQLCVETPGPPCSRSGPPRLVAIGSA
jgi:hypothetical protein